MFGSKQTSSGPTVVGEGTVIVGTLRAQGRVQIDGSVEGDVEVQGQVSLGPNGRVQGELVADDVAVGGEVVGRVVARHHLHVVATGRVQGELHYGTLQVERGARLEGQTRHQVHTEASAANATAATDSVATLAAPVPLRPSQRPKAAAR